MKRLCVGESGMGGCPRTAIDGLWMCIDHAGSKSLEFVRNKKNNGGSSSYYELPKDCDTLQDIIVKQGMDFTQGNIFKAAYRWDKKPDLEYNLNKIIWFAKDALDRLYMEDPNNPRGNSYDDRSDSS